MGFRQRVIPKTTVSVDGITLTGPNWSKGAADERGGAAAGRQKGAGIAASPRVTGLRPCDPEGPARPGFGGMLCSRRQGHASVASVVEAGCFRTRRRVCARTSAARFETARGQHQSLAGYLFPVIPKRSNRLRRPLARGVGHRSRGASARSSASCLRLRFGIPLRIRSSEHPVLVSAPSPGGRSCFFLAV